MKNRIRFFRQQRGLTQANLASRLATTAATVSRLETEDIRISTDWLKAIADTLEVSVADLIADGNRLQVALAGHLDALGRFSQKPTKKHKFLPFLYGDIETIAARLEDDIGPYRRGEVVVGDRISKHPFTSALGKDCLLQTEGGSAFLCRFLKDPSKDDLSHIGVELHQGGATVSLSHLLWVAPIRLVLREI